MEIIISIKDKQAQDQMSEYDSLIYSYFLYFCGIPTLEIDGKDELKKFFENKIQNTKYNRS